MSQTNAASTLIDEQDATEPVDSFPSFRIVTHGLGGGATADLQRSTDNGESWTTVATYTADQAGTVVSESVPAAQHRLVLTANPGGEDVAALLTKES